MTKKMLRLELMRQEMEAWETLQMYKKEFGDVALITIRQRGEWQAINRINKMLSDADFGTENQ